MKNIYSYAFGGCTKLTTVNFGTGLKSIGSNAFENCESLVTVKMPSNLISIESNAFRHCYKLKNLSFNSKLETINKGAFNNCDSLEKVVIPDSVKYIYTDYESWRDERTFGHCDNLKTVVIGKGLEYIDSRTFQGCKSLESVTIGNGVKNIYSYAFEGCKNLSKVYYFGNAPSINESAFSNTSSNITFYYKSGATGFNNIGYKAAIFDPNDTHRTVTFKPNGGSGGDVKITTLKGLTTAMPAEPTKTGYTFKGWYTNKECSGTQWDFSTNVVQNNTTLYAKWSLNKYTLKFNARGGKTPTSSKSVSYNTQIGTLPTPTRSGYVFAGWYPAQDGSGTKYTSKSKMPARNMTLYAKWTKKLSAPSNVKASKASSTSIKVTWSKVSGAKKYEVYRATSKSGKYTKVATVTATNYTNKKLSKGKTYYYKVVACGSTSSANSTYSTIVKASTK